MMTPNSDPQAKMPNENTDENLEAMLYLLEDPALDRDAFEARLADDARLGEILAQAVTTFQSLWSARFESEQVAQFSPQSSLPQIVSSQSRIVAQWQFVSVLAASLLLAGFVGWQMLFSMRSGSTENGSNHVVLAWGDIQSAALDMQGDHDVSDIELENTFAMTDLHGEIDVPEWLVMAATDTVEGYDSDNGRAIVQ